MSKEKELFDALEDLSEAEEDKYEELEIDYVEKVTDKAALIVRGKPFDPPVPAVWFPLSQLRKLDGTVYASRWILEQKGID